MAIPHAGATHVTGLLASASHTLLAAPNHAQNGHRETLCTPCIAPWDPFRLALAYSFIFLAPDKGLRERPRTH